MTKLLTLTFTTTLILTLAVTAEKPSLSGIYPHLTMFNTEGECGTGAVVPWQGKLWVITYGPHKPNGSDDKLYSISPDLIQTIHPESIGGTPANRLIHRESDQLFIGSYAVDAKSKVRVIPFSEMFGRHTATARHITDPSKKVVTATMEEGIYEIDSKSLKVTELWGDEDNAASKHKSGLPGYHGKGFYSGQGVYVYANNGERGKEAQTIPETSSGVLAEWDGKADKWKVIRRNQFTEVTGPGGIYGNENPATDPIWAIGWDHRSLLLGVRMPDVGWTFYRLPKGSHSYDGAHGWNTEWPRIREIGQKDLLMTMHGTFWKFPQSFTPKNSSGISPRSNYLKVIGDFTEWNGKLIMGCDDTAALEFLNKRKAKGHVPATQSQSNLWFIDEPTLDKLGPIIGRGAVWVAEPVKKNVPSDAFLFSGYERRGLHLHHDADKNVTFTLEIDRKGNGQWESLREVEVPAASYQFVSFQENEIGAWIRVTSNNDLTKASAVFTYHHKDDRSVKSDPIFTGVARAGQPMTAGLVRALGDDRRSLSYEAVDQNGKRLNTYELDADLKLKVADDIKLDESFKIPSGIILTDKASVIYVDDKGKRWRLPKGDAALDDFSYRICREVATERDLFNASGTFYELPAENAGGFSKARPIATHNCFIQDFCSYRGLFIISGIANDAPKDNPHIIRSDDGKAALWAGGIDDIWKLGKPVGNGGPWLETKVEANIPSDPYLMTAYDKKSLQLSYDDQEIDQLEITAQIDIHGDGTWVNYKRFTLKSGQSTSHEFPADFSAYWIRFISNKTTTASAQLTYQ